jgi:hypothetical protein
MDSIEKAVIAAYSSDNGPGGIGTLGEKTLHSALKNYLEPDPAFHEVRIGNHYADIFNGHGVFEIQTRHFNKLRQKLDSFLKEYPVTIVYPVAYHKWLLWVDERTGEVTKRRLSPKRGGFCEIFPELYRIKNYLPHNNLRILIIRLDMDEYRLLNGWSEDRKRGSRRQDRIPVSVHDELLLSSPADYAKLVPETLEEPFTSRDFSKAAKISLSAARTALNILNSLGTVKRVGKRSNSYLYESQICAVTRI